VPQPANAALYKQYQALAEATPGVHFVGRLATYKYYNMDQVVAQALSVFERLHGRRRAADAPEVVSYAPVVARAHDVSEAGATGDVGRNGVHRQPNR
jgi:hypothetical protein